MRKTLTLLFASTALTAAVSLPAWSAISAPADGSPQPFAAVFEEAAQALPLILASDDDDDDRDFRGLRVVSDGGDDDDEDDDDDGEDDDESGGAPQSCPRWHRRAAAERALRQRCPAKGPGELSLLPPFEQGPD